jgi:DNA polymerase-3 subunit gamma/tau
MPSALYRTYRPKKLADLVGQETTATLLQNAAATGRLGHAYLFYGSRGTGKTTTARILAKLFNCETRATDQKFRATGEPCNNCTACREIDSGVSLDVIEIDGASNRGIDEIRNLKESIRAVPSAGRYKVYIIDEAHMLTGAAWNALLKTLEEPPKHGVIVLATTEYDKLPATIVSRVQRFLFKKPTKSVIMEKLEAVAEAEKIALEPAALELIAAAAEGSFRDAESLLDQARSLAASGAKITLTGVEELIGRVGFARVHDLAVAVIGRDLPAALELIAAQTENGTNMVALTKDLIHYLRKIVAFGADPKLEPFLAADLTADELERLKKLAGQLPAEFGITLIEKLLTAYSEMRYSPFATIPLEIALIELLGGK